MSHPRNPTNDSSIFRVFCWLLQFRCGLFAGVLLQFFCCHGGPLLTALGTPPGTGHVYDSFFSRHQFVGRYTISMHAYRKWRACWPCVCLVFDVVPFSKSTSHAACVERHECNARAWEKLHAWLWAWSGILQSKDANANRVPLLLRNEKTQPRFVYHMGMCAVCHSISFLSSGTCNQKPDIIHCCTWASPFDLFVFPCGIFWVFSSLCFVLMQPSHPAQKDWLWMIACSQKIQQNQSTLLSVWYNRIVYSLVS